LFVGGLVTACGGGEAPRQIATPVAEETTVWRSVDPPAAPGALAPSLKIIAGHVTLSWLEPLAEDRHRLIFSRFGDAGWTAPVEVVEGGDFFANWADLPAVTESGDGSLVAHWLAKTGEETYAYSIFLARSRDGGASWSELGQLNDDDTSTEHGFVSYVKEEDGLRAFWLDGREMAAGGDMTLRTAWIGESVSASQVLDPRVCECCSTDAVGSAAGALVVYRDRGDEETRDVTRLIGAADEWTAPAVVAADGWKLLGCPVNGPAVDAQGEQAALAWFTGADEAPRVQAALSTDGGHSFGSPVVVDPDEPAGRVDVVLDGQGGAVVSWLAVTPAGASVRLRWVSADGRQGEPIEVAITTAARASGFPRLALLGGSLYLVWVDTGPADGQRLRALAMPLERLPRPA
jgi:hypothetical protein